jgi:putative ABC transport system permease protein
MKLGDMIELGLTNLWRTKLRTSLTTLGVVIGIGALTSMVSFGTGMEKNITDTFRKNDLFTSIYVTSKKIDLEGIADGDLSGMLKNDQGRSIPLNDSTINIIRDMKEVEVAFPEITFQAKAEILGKEKEVRVEGIPYSMHQYQPFNEITFGKFFDNDSSVVVILNWNLLKRMNVLVDDPQKPIILDDKEKAKGLILVNPDSIIGKPLYLKTVILDISSLYLSSFGFTRNQRKLPVKDVTTLFIIGGIIKGGPFGSQNIKGDIIIPYSTAAKIPRLPVSNMMDLFGGDHDTGSYSSVYVRAKDPGNIETVIKKLKEMKFNVFSLADQFKEIRQSFLIMDGILGAIGTIALIIAGLGIMNTMIMSILERTREIGIMKAIGGSELQIRMIFFVEAGVIGFIGALFGLVLGWGVTLIANKIANAVTMPIGEAYVNFFYFPPWLIFGAIAFSIILSLAAGVYPAIRASRVDPVKALRHD